MRIEDIYLIDRTESTNDLQDEYIKTILAIVYNEPKEVIAHDVQRKNSETPSRRYVLREPLRTTMGRTSFTFSEEMDSIEISCNNINKERLSGIESLVKIARLVTGLPSYLSINKTERENLTEDDTSEWRFEPSIITSKKLRYSLKG